MVLATKVGAQTSRSGGQGLQKVLRCLEEKVKTRKTELERLAGLKRLAEVHQAMDDKARATNLYEEVFGRTKTLEDANQRFHWSLVAADGLRHVAPVHRYLPIYRQLVQQNAGHLRAPDVQEHVIGVYEELGDLNSAAVECERFARLFPKHSQAEHYQYRAAESYYKGGMHDLCAAEVEKAFEVCKDKKPDLLLLAGLNLMAQKKDEAAVAAWKRLDREFPNAAANARGLFLQGYTHLTLQQYTEAKAALDRLVAVFPDSSYAKRAADLSVKVERVLQASGSTEGSGHANP